MTIQNYLLVYLDPMTDCPHITRNNKYKISKAHQGVYINIQFYSIDLLPSTDAEIKTVLLHSRFERNPVPDTKGFSREHCIKRVSMGILQISMRGKTEHKAWYQFCFFLLKFRQPNHPHRTKPGFQTESASPGDTQLSSTLAF